MLVNNVGGNVAAGFFADSDPASWQGNLDITLMTTLQMTHAALPGMIARKAGRIVNIGSTASPRGDHMLPVHSTAKAAMHSFTPVLGKEGRPAHHHRQPSRALRHDGGRSGGVPLGQPLQS